VYVTTALLHVVLGANSPILHQHQTTIWYAFHLLVKFHLTFK